MQSISKIEQITNAKKYMTVFNSYQKIQGFKNNHSLLYSIFSLDFVKVISRIIKYFYQAWVMCQVLILWVEFGTY